MTYRIRATAPIDGDAVSPDSIEAAQAYLTRAIEQRAEALGVAINWNSWHTYVKKKRSGDLIVIQWARVARG